MNLELEGLLSFLVNTYFIVLIFDSSSVAFTITDPAFFKSLNISTLTFTTGLVESFFITWDQDVPFPALSLIITWTNVFCKVTGIFKVLDDII